MDNKISLPVMAKHFQDAVFDNVTKCPIANAAKEYFNLEEGDQVTEVYKWLQIKKKGALISTRFNHADYRLLQYNEDVNKAISANYDETVIFELELIEEK